MSGWKFRRHSRVMCGPVIRPTCNYWWTDRTRRPRCKHSTPRLAWSYPINRIAPARNRTTRVPIDIRPQMLYNPAMKSPNFYIPGVIGIVLQIGTTFATAMAVVREREKGTLETLLVSPLSRWGLMLGKLVPYLCIGMTMAMILFLIMRFLFGVPIAGNVIAMMFATLVYVFALLSLGLLVATKAENQMQALQMSMVFMLPSVFFSGFVFPRETMPPIFYALSTILPATYFSSRSCAPSFCAAPISSNTGRTSSSSSSCRSCSSFSARCAFARKIG